MEFKHIPVLLNQVIDGLSVKPNGVYLDCTIGGGGHGGEILKKLEHGTLIGIDRDDDALTACAQKFDGVKNVKLLKGNFKDAKRLLEENQITRLDGVLVDLGVSSYQLDNDERGFSFLHDAKLDMRMDRSSSITAYDVVNTYSEDKLKYILYTYGEESFAGNIVRNIIKARGVKPIETTIELKDIIESSIPKKIMYKMGGASKKTFQAIRIEVNGELTRLDEAIADLIGMLKPGGKIAIISFHSLEDRIVKNVFKEKATQCICPPKIPICICKHKAEIKLVTRKPIIADECETKANSRSTCAKLRIAEKL